MVESSQSPMQIRDSSAGQDKNSGTYSLDVIKRCDQQLSKDEQFLERLYKATLEPRLEGEALRSLFVDVNNLLNYITRISLPVNFKPS